MLQEILWEILQEILQEILWEILYEILQEILWEILWEILQEILWKFWGKCWGKSCSKFCGKYCRKSCGKFCGKWLGQWCCFFKLTRGWGRYTVYHQEWKILQMDTKNPLLTFQHFKSTFLFGVNRIENIKIILHHPTTMPNPGYAIMMIPCRTSRTHWPCLILVMLLWWFLVGPAVPIDPA